MVTTGDDFVAYIDAEYQDAIENNEDWGWSIDYAFAAYPAGSDDPNAGNQVGEWVNAQFTSTHTNPDSELESEVFYEFYHIVDGKIQEWSQFKRDVLRK